jgi:hypothetical protein
LLLDWDAVGRGFGGLVVEYGSGIGFNSGAAKGPSGESMAVGQHLAVRDIRDEIAGRQDGIH